jgi:hypothetical protein
VVLVAVGVSIAIWANLGDTPEDAPAAPSTTSTTFVPVTTTTTQPYTPPPPPVAPPPADTGGDVYVDLDPDVDVPHVPHVPRVFKPWRW